MGTAHQTHFPCGQTHFRAEQTHFSSGQTHFRAEQTAVRRGRGMTVAVAALRGIARAVTLRPMPTVPTPPQPREPIGFFSRLNPKATGRSVVRRACVMVIVGAALWGLCLVFRAGDSKWQPTWPTLIWWLFCFALTGAVLEWQVPDDDGNDAKHDAGQRPPA
jgi:hypothetical protein